MKIKHKILSLLASALVIVGTLPMSVQAETPPYGTGQYTSVTLTAGSAKDFWTDTMSFLASSGDRGGMIMTDDAAADGTGGTTYQKLAARSALFDSAFTPAESDENYDITVQRGETFYLAVKHDISASGYLYLSEIHTVLTYAAGAFSPAAMGEKFGSHPANQLMGQTVLASSTPNVQQTAFASGLNPMHTSIFLTRMRKMAEKASVSA